MRDANREGIAVTNRPEDRTAELAAGLVDVLPRLLRRLRGDVPLAPPEGGSPAGPEWQSLTELRGASGQVALMSLLVEQQRATMQYLAGRLAVTPATVTMMVKRLLAQGYVARERDTEDWRLVWISPTERGREAIAFYNHERRASLARRLSLLGEEDRAALAAALPALRRLVEAG